MTTQVNILEIAKELKATAEHMQSLALLLENAEELENLQAKLDQLLGNPMLAQAVTTLTGTPARQNTGNPGEAPARSAESTGAVKKTEAHPYRQKVMELYETDGTDLSLMADPVDEWAEAKAMTVLANPELHPDSVTVFGTVMARPWTWQQVKMLVERFGSEPVETVAKAVCRCTADVTKLAASIGLKPYTASTEPEDVPAVPNGTKQTEADEDKPEPAESVRRSLEKYMPEDVRDPSPAKRLKIFRLTSGITYDELASETGIRKKTLLKLETGSVAMSTYYQTHLADAMCLERNAFSSMPMTDVLDPANSGDVRMRLKILRLRFGMTEREFENRTGLEHGKCEEYERDGLGREQARRICAALKVGFEVFADLYETPAESKFVLEHKPTGEKLTHLRISKRMSLQELANASGISMSYISQIENGRHNPSDAVVNKLAIALKCPPGEIVGDQNTGLRPIKTT